MLVFIIELVYTNIPNQARKSHVFNILYKQCKFYVFTLILLDLFPNEQNFDLDKSRQKFHHSLKEHHKISNIPKFRCEML